jgi:hypothetical protein
LLLLLLLLLHAVLTVYAVQSVLMPSSPTDCFVPAASYSTS